MHAQRKQGPRFQAPAGLYSELSGEVELVTWPLTWNKGHLDVLTKVVLSGLLWGHWRLTSLPAPQGAIFHMEIMPGVLLVLAQGL